MIAAHKDPGGIFYDPSRPDKKYCSTCSQNVYCSELRCPCCNQRLRTKARYTQSRMIMRAVVRSY
jgi:hypothetical protein